MILISFHPFFNPDLNGKFKDMQVYYWSVL